MFAKKWLRIAGYVAFAIAAFLFFFYMTFPAEAVAQRLAQELAQRSNGAVTVTFENASLYRFSGIQADTVKLRASLDSSGKAAPAPLELELDSLWVRVQILPLVLLNIAASAGAELGEGSIEALVASQEAGVDFDLSFEDLDFASPPLLAKVVGMPVGGKLAGKAKGTLGVGTDRRATGSPPGLAPEKSEGQASVTMRDVSFGPGTVAGFTIPAPIGFGQLDLAFDMKRGRLRLASFQQKGGQVRLRASGGMTLRRNFSASALDTCLQFKFVDEEYLKTHTKVGTALQLAQVELKKDAEGFLHIKHGGTAGSPRRQRGLCRQSSRTQTRRGRQ